MSEIEQSEAEVRASEFADVSQTGDVLSGDAGERRDESPDVELRRQRATMLEGVREVRKFSADGLEMRETSDGMLRFTGYASVTEHRYDVGGFSEMIARGAFKRTLGEQPDVVLLVNHGDGGGLPLARTKSGTMTLTEDARGLRVDADLNPNDPDVQSLAPKLQRGDVDEMSFAFRATDDEWSEDYKDRLIRSVALHKGDVSIVTHGANDAATGELVTVRASDGTLELRAGKTLSAKNRSELEAIRDQITGLLDTAEKDPSLVADAAGVLDAQAVDDRADDAEVEERKPIPLPDHTTRARERLAALRRAA